MTTFQRGLAGLQFPLTHTTTSGVKHEATIVSIGASLREYKVDGVDVVIPYAADEFTPVFSGIVLFPWPNRLEDGLFEFEGTTVQVPINEIDNNNQLHSFSENYEFECLDYQENLVTLALTLPYTRFYPYEIRVVITYSLDDEGLKVHTKAQNVGKSNAPFGLGWHPVFSYGGSREEAILTLPSETHVTVNDRMLPTGEVPVEPYYDFRTARAIGDTNLDDAFLDFTTHEVTLERIDNHTTTVYSGEEYPAWQLCTIDGIGSKNEKGIFIEPCTCYANAFKTGRFLIALKPSETREFNWGIKFK
ncbi:MAG: hypothetical protein LBN08_07395 [Lactobacillales bacterium]|jgi:aldose 1-epimerase|nr:hypothetical protein [Lactobacillales bacterium]